ncbi:MAG: hypothetical protein P8Y67_00580 [Alphaproteobacteria bacterium]
MSTIVDFRLWRDAACIARPPMPEDKSMHPAMTEGSADIILFPRVKRRVLKKQGLRKALKRRFTLRA